MDVVKTMVFDDVFRTMAQKMPGLIIALINEVFDTDYTEKDIDAQLRNEFMEKEGKIISDSIFRIKGHIYHIEAQSVSDTTMVVRMFEYDFAIALEEAMRSGKPYEINFPESCVLYIRNDNNVCDDLSMRVIMPNGQTCDYSTKVIKAANYTRDDIFKKKLLCLLPYYILRYEKEIGAIEGSESRTKELLEEYQDIVDRLWNEMDEERKSAMYVDLMSLIKDISDHVLRNTGDLKTKVGDIMGGKILELESERLTRIGREEGLNKGRNEERIAAIERMIRANATDEQMILYGYSKSEIDKVRESLFAPA